MKPAGVYFSAVVELEVGCAVVGDADPDAARAKALGYAGHAFNVAPHRSRVRLRVEAYCARCCGLGKVPGGRRRGLIVVCPACGGRFPPRVVEDRVVRRGDADVGRCSGACCADASPTEAAS